VAGLAGKSNLEHKQIHVLSSARVFALRPEVLRATVVLYRGEECDIALTGKGVRDRQREG